MKPNLVIRSLISIGLALIFYSATFAQVAESFKNLDDAKKAAAISQKLIFVTFELNAEQWMGRIIGNESSPTGIYYGTEKGSPCTSFILPAGATENFIYAYIPYEAEPALRIQYYAEDKTALVLDAYGNELYAEVCKGRDKIMPMLKSLPNDASRYYSLLKFLGEHPDSVEIKLALADLCQSYHATTASRRYYKELEKTRRFNQDSTLSDHVRCHEALNAFLGFDYNEAWDLLSEQIENYPRSLERPMQLFLLSRIALLKKNKNDALHYFNMLQVEFPDNQHTGWAKTLLDQYKEE